jgi:hypothetical protein
MQFQQMQLFFKFPEHQPALATGDNDPVQPVLCDHLTDMFNPGLEAGIWKYFTTRYLILLLNLSFQSRQIYQGFNMVAAPAQKHSDVCLVVHFFASLLD